MSWENQIFLKRCTQLRPHLGSSHFILFCFKYLSFGTSFLSWAFLWKAALIFHWGSYSFLLEFTRKSVLWWNKSSLEFSYRHREHCHWWWSWKKLNISGREFGGLILSLQFHRSYRIEILTQIIVLSSFTEMVLTMSSKRVYVRTNIVQFCRSYRIKEPTY